MPQIPAGWKETTLGEVSDITSSKRIFANEYKTSWIPFFRGKEITEKFYGNSISTELFISEERYKELEKTVWVPQEGDILLTSVWTLGNPYLVEKGMKFYFKDWNITRFHNFKDISPKWLFYRIISPIGKEILSHAKIGSTQQAYTIISLKQLPILLPPLPEQQAIAAVLSSFDDKIELLRAENQTLEQMGQELFRERFGKWKIGDELPEGWRVGKLGEIAEITSWKRPSEISDTRNSLFEIPLIWATKIMGYVQNFLFDGETLVIGRVWTHWEVQIFYEKIHPSDNTLVIKSNNFYFTYFILKSIDYEKINRGAVQPLITQSDLKNYLVILPSQETLFKFNLVIKPLFNKIRANSEQIQILSSTRDQLLPKLMSGEVRVEF